MKIVYEPGNVFEGNEDFLVHGCNAQGVMGRGVALTVKEHYRPAFEAYRATYLEQGRRLHLGQVIPVKCPASPAYRARTIVNAITQDRYSGMGPGHRYVDYGAVRKAVDTVNAMPEVKGKRVGFPLIGAGLAGGSWPVIAEAIEAGAVDFVPVVYLYGGAVPRT